MWTDESERVPPGVTPVRCPAPAELLGKPRCNTQPGSLKRHRREPASSLTGNHAEAGEAVASPTDTDVMCLLIKHHSMQMISGVPAGAAAHTKSRASFPHQRRQTAPITPTPPAHAPTFNRTHPCPCPPPPHLSDEDVGVQSMARSAASRSRSVPFCRC